MKERSKAYYELRAQVAKALAHPTRLFLLDALKQRDCCVCELTEMVDADQSTVSKHLAVLKQVGLVSMRREGPMAFYHLECPCLEVFFQCMESVLSAKLNLLQKGTPR